MMSNKKIIKVTTQHPDWPLIRQTINASGVLDDCHFFINREDITECDYWFILEGLLKTEKVLCPRNNVFLVTWEPPSFRSYNSSFVNQFGRVITCHPNLKHKELLLSQQAHPWFVNKSFDELKKLEKIPKTKLMSIIVSNKIFTEGHRKRYEFAMNLKRYFGGLVDIYGRGIKDFDDKWSVLAPYKYSVAIENCVHHNWLTEKLPDCFLAATFPFYYGCPNVREYFDESAFSEIDIDDIEKSIKIIENNIFDKSHYDRHYESLIIARGLYLDRLSLFPLLKSFIDQDCNSKINGIPKAKSRMVYPESQFKGGLVTSKIKQKLRKVTSFIFK